VIPVRLDDAATEIKVPYGLLGKHGLYLSKAGSLEKIASRLLETLRKQHPWLTLYDGRDGDMFHFKGHPNSFWTGRGAEARRTSPISEGQLRVEPRGVLTVTRENFDGRFEIWLLDPESRETKGGVKVFPAKDQVSSYRKLWVHCEARTDGSRQTLRFILKNEETERWIADEVRTVEAEDWTEIDVYFRVDPTKDFWLRIDQEEVSKVPSLLKIRAIVLKERL